MDSLHEHYFETMPPANTAAVQRAAGRSAPAAIRDLWRGLGNRLERAVSRMLTWQDRRIGRRVLQSMSDHALRDIGLTRVDVLRESRKPFWRA